MHLRFPYLSFTVLLLAAVVLSASCNKRKGDNQDLDPNNQQPNDYMSTQTGSWWLFGADDGKVYKRMATGQDSMKNGLLFSYYESIDTNSHYITPEYFGKNGNKYVSLFDLDGSQSNYITVVLLEDSAQTGDAWSNTQTYQSNYDLLVESHVVSTDGTLTLNGETYTNVTHVYNTLFAKPKVTPNYIDCGNINVWFAKGVGLVKEDADISVLGIYNLQHKDSLLAYHIEP